MRNLVLLGAAAAFAAALSAQEFKLGSKVGDFPLKTVQGSPVRFSEVRGPVTVIAFIATQCPVSNAYNGRMAALYKEYAPKGVNFVFINSNRQESAAEVASHAQSHFPFPVYKDENNVVADRFGATVTPEVFIVGRDGVVAYHGSIDDSQELRRVTEKRAEAALEAVLAGKPVEKPQTKAFGCSIKRVPKTS